MCGAPAKTSRTSSGAWRTESILLYTGPISQYRVLMAFPRGQENLRIGMPIIFARHGSRMLGDEQKNTESNKMKTAITHCRRFARIALATILLAVNACDDKCCRLEVHATPPVSEENADLAGLEVEIDGHTFRPKDFAMTANDTRWAVSTSVPKYGNQQVFVRIINDGRRVADGSISWMLRPDSNWHLWIDLESSEDDAFLSGDCEAGYATFSVADPTEGEQGDTVHLCLKSVPSEPVPGALYNLSTDR